MPVTLAQLRANAEAMAKLNSALWRLSSGFYSIVNKTGEVVAFVPKPMQIKLLRSVIVDGHNRWLIVKARQQGFSTLIDLMMLDFCHFTDNVQGVIIDLNQAEASVKLSGKIGAAHERMFPEVRRKADPCSGSEIGFSNGSVIFAGLNARGGTNHFMHVSELGYIAFHDAGRAEKIRSGALPSVPDDGYCFIESTFMGGRGGMFYEMIKRAQEVPDAQKTIKDFRLLFSAWHDDATCTLAGDMSRVSKDTHKYLDHVQAVTGKTFTDGQRLWYQVTADEQGIFMKRENPSLIEECWSAPVEGAIYADLLARARAEGRIYDFEYDRAYPVFTSWDIGWDDTTEVWWFQLRGNRINIIKHVSRKKHTPAQMVNVVREAGIPVATHYLPHDASHGSFASGGATVVDGLERAGLKNLKVVNRIPDLWIGINMVRDLLPRCEFNLKGCADGIGALEVYHSKDDSSGAAVKRAPVHDWSSHAADAIRTMAEAMNAGMVSDTPGAARVMRAPQWHRGEGAIAPWA